MKYTFDSVDAILQGATGPTERVGFARDWLDNHLRDNPSLARELIATLLPEVQGAGDALGAAWLHFSLGWLALDGDDYTQGLTAIETAKATFADLGDGEGLSRCLNALGVASFSTGVYDLALDYYRESVGEADRIGRPDLAGAASMNLAECLYALEEPAEALQVIEHCREAYRVAPHNVTFAHSVAGLIYRSLGRLVEAEAETRQAIASAGSATHDALEARQILIEIFIDSGRLDEAEPLVAEGLADCVQAGARLLGTRFRLSRARIEALREHPLEAIADIDAAIRTAQAIGARRIESDAEKAAYLVWQGCAQWEKALAAHVRHARLRDAMKSEQASRRILGLHNERVRSEARYFESLYQQVSAIGEIGQRLTANLDLEITLETIYEAVNSLMDAPTLLIARVDDSKQQLNYCLIMVQGKRIENFTAPLQAGHLGCWCVNHDSDIVIGDLQTEFQRYVHSYDELKFDGTVERSMVFVPLRVGAKVVGVFSVQSHIANAYDKRKVETIRAIGTYVAIAMENSRLFRELQRLATLDGLTGLVNRRCFTQALDAAYQCARRRQRTDSVIMIDLDHFKEVNDSHGHDAGDQVLRAIARVLTEKVRCCDTVGRMGGEEFTILLPETALDGAAALAERLREAVAALPIALPEGRLLGVTASFGVAVSHHDDPAGEAVLKRADQALYRAKEGGRNQVATEAEAPLPAMPRPDDPGACC